jgi:hypothetical protein
MMEGKTGRRERKQGTRNSGKDNGYLCQGVEVKATSWPGRKYREIPWVLEDYGFSLARQRRTESAGYGGRKDHLRSFPTTL